MLLKMNIAFLLGMFVTVFTLYTSAQLVFFLSFYQEKLLTSSQVGYFKSTGVCVLWNLCLVLLFVVQHSLQKRMKPFFINHDGQVFERLFYNIGTCVILQILMGYWQPISWWTIWKAPNSYVWLFTLVHVVAWAIIYGGCYVLDLSELLGIKQVFYAVQELPDPLSLKSDELRRFYSHMRHPGFSAFAVVLFFHPHMQLDRLLLAFSLLGYIVLTCKVDLADYVYHERLRRRKKRELDEFIHNAVHEHR